MFFDDTIHIRLDLHTACAIGAYDYVRTHISDPKNDINRVNIGGWSPLMYASYVGRDTIVNLLLESGRVNVNEQGSQGETALMLAVGNGHESVAYFLLHVRKCCL